MTGISQGQRTIRLGLAALLATGGLVLGVMAQEVAAATGTPPTVTVGTDQTLNLGDTAFLRGRVSDDGLPDPSQLTGSWSKVSGPGTVSFGRTDEFHTYADFGATGTYVLRLSVSDGGGTASDDLSVTVRSAPTTTLRVPADYSTIQAALNAAPAHALVLVSPGTYRETLTVPRTLTLASTFYTTGDRSMIDQTVISGASVDLESVVVSSGAAPDTHIVGFKVTGGKDGIKVRGAAVVQDNLMTGLGTDGFDFPRDAAGLVKHNVMEGNGDDAIDVNESSVVIVDNRMTDNAGEGVETRTTNMTAPVDEVTIRGNEIRNNTQDGLQIIDDDTITSSPAQSATIFRIDRNIIAGNTQAGLGLMDAGVTSEDYRAASLVERVEVTNNTFDGNNYGITGGNNLVAVNNVFARHPGTALKNVDGASRTAYNHFYANGTAYVGSNVDTATAFTGDPMLDSTFAPLPGSPLIDEGTAAYSLPSGERVVDITGFNGTAPDIGAVESSGSGGGTTNKAPVVDAGPDRSVTLPDGASLAGTASDDGLPQGSTLSVQWGTVSGPGTVTFANPGSASTSASFSAAGTYQLRLTASDGALTSSDTTTVTVSSGTGGGGTATTVQARVSAGSDDAEERSGGSVDVASSDLELVTDGSAVQTVGVRFPALAVPRGAQVTAASIQFQTDEVSTDTASLTIRGQAADNAATFSTATGNVSGRARTTAATTWSPPAWSTVGAKGAEQRTPDLAGVVQEVVNRSGWVSGNALAFVITGSGRRTAEAFEGGAPPVLQVSYVTGGGGGTTNSAPAVDAGPDRSVTLPDAASLAGAASDDGLPQGSTLSVQWGTVSGPGTVTFANAAAASTTATFSAAGTYQLRLTGTDGELSSSDTTTVTVSPTSGGGTTTTVTALVAAGSDDAEERSGGGVSLTSTDLELVADGSSVQTVGLRFGALAVPSGAVVVKAWIQFSTDEVTTAATSLSIRAQAADNAATFTTATGNVSSRPRTSAVVGWVPAAWNTGGERGTAQQTPDLSSVLQEVVSRTGWRSGNAAAFVVTGTGTRTAVAFEKSATAAPLLHVEYRMP